MPLSEEVFASHSIDNNEFSQLRADCEQTKHEIKVHLMAMEKLSPYYGQGRLTEMDKRNNAPESWMDDQRLKELNEKIENTQWQIQSMIHELVSEEPQPIVGIKPEYDVDTNAAEIFEPGMELQKGAIELSGVEEMKGKRGG
jgi:hypothetical protein